MSLQVATDPTGPLLTGTTYDPKIPTPDELLGFPLAQRLAHPAQVVAAFRKWDESSPRMLVASHGESHEGRELIHAIISSEENLANWESIKRDLGRLADPRSLSQAEADTIIASTPAVAWLGYSIHGDEVSGVDASLAVAHHLIAGQSDELDAIRKATVVVIEPVMNPDGRQRIVSQIEQTAGVIPSTDFASMHRGRWPWGRGNHYLFDMNRDWLPAITPETRGRLKALQTIHPQLHVDAHEMGPLDTYLFYPRSEPINPHMARSLRKWTREFAKDAAAAFDAQGWSYYTREWADGWYPGYSDAWASLNGAIGILYEQAGVAGQPLRRSAGELVTYRQTVQGHTVASLANVSSLARHREAVLADYLANRRLPLAAAEELFVVQVGSHPDRERVLIETLLRHGVEIGRSRRPIRCRRGRGPLGAARERFDAGSLVVSTRQPQGALVRAFLELDTRLPREVLLEERKQLETRNRSELYDVNAWDLAHAFDLDASWCAATRVDTDAVEWPQPRKGTVEGPERATAWIVDGTGDRSVAFAAQAMEAGLAVRLARRPFSAAGRKLPRGSLVLRGAENPDGGSKVAKVAAATGIKVTAVDTGLSGDEGPDLGGRHFELLHRPRIAVITNAPVSTSDYGHVWHQLDRELGVPFSLVDAQAFAAHDLRRYSVLIVPPTNGGGETFVVAHKDALETWVRNGGTLIALGRGAHAVAASGLGSVVRRRDVLMDLDRYRKPVARELRSREVELDEPDLWSPKPSSSVAPHAEGSTPPAALPPRNGFGTPTATASEAPKPSKHEDDARDEDAWLRRFSPKGVIARGLVSEHEWIAVGAGPELPVFVTGDTALMSKSPATAPVRLAKAERLRLAGLLWPEARERLATTAYVTVERIGHGQLILFAAPPTFRGYFLATARLFANAVVYGPGLGARQPLGW